MEDQFLPQPLAMVCWVTKNTLQGQDRNLFLLGIKLLIIRPYDFFTPESLFGLKVKM